MALARLDAVPDVAAFTALYVNGVSLDMACVSSVVRLSGDRVESVQSSHVEFATRWSDAKEFLTSNSAQVMPFGPVRGQSLVRFAGLNDLGLLYEIHKARVVNDGPLARAWLPSEGEELDYVRDGVTRWLEAQVARGNLRHVKSAEQHRLTWRGAWRATWRLLPPFKQREVRRVARVSERVLKATGIALPTENAALIAAANAKARASAG